MAPRLRRLSVHSALIAVALAIACAAAGTPVEAAQAAFSADLSIDSTSHSSAAHPTLTTKLTTDPSSTAQDLQSAEITFPRGLWASDNDGNYCDLDFDGKNYFCHNESAQVGTAKILAQIDFDEGPGVDLHSADIDAKVYLERPQSGELAQLVTITDLNPNSVQVAPVHLNSNSSGIVADFRDFPTTAVIGETTLDTHVYEIETVLDGFRGQTPVTFNPTFCDPNNGFSATINSYGADGVPSADDEQVERDASYKITGCSGVGFNPTLSTSLTSSLAGATSSPISQMSLAPDSATVAELKLSMPSQFLLNPGASFGRCPIEQFDRASCDAGSQIGTLTTAAQLTAAPLVGKAYLGPNDSGRIRVGVFFPDPYRFRIDGYLEKRSDHGVDLQMSLPPIPVTGVSFSLGSGSGEVLLNPSACGSYATTTTLTSHSGISRQVDTPLAINGCSPTARNAPKLKAQLSTHRPNRFANLRLSVEQDPESLSGARFSLPKGFALAPKLGRATPKKRLAYIEFWDDTQQAHRGTLSLAHPARRGRKKQVVLTSTNRQLKGLRILLDRDRRRPVIALVGVPKARITDFSLSIFGRHSRLLKTPGATSAGACLGELSFQVDLFGSQSSRTSAADRIVSSC